MTPAKAPCESTEERNQKITQRCIFFEESFEILQETFNFNVLYLNERIVHNMVSSYYDDLDRLKDYHSKMKLVNEHKIAAYTIKWIIFMHPIQIPNETEEQKRTKRELLANELFAWLCARSILGIDHITQVEADTRFSMIYTFRYRHFTGRSLTTTCKTLQELALENEKSSQLQAEPATGRD